MEWWYTSGWGLERQWIVDKDLHGDIEVGRGGVCQERKG